MPSFLMTDPACFDVSYRINPWMQPKAWTAERLASAKAHAFATFVEGVLAH